MFRNGTRWAHGQPGKLLCVRLAPGEDLLRALAAIAEREELSGAIILGGAASLRRAKLRNLKVFLERWPITDANRVWTTLEGPLELVSITGNVSRFPDGRVHVHSHVVVSTARHGGRTFGGHLGEGTEILSTGELALIEVANLRLRRDRDPMTLGEELFPEPAEAEKQDTVWPGDPKSE